jgi:hypothetical protein
MDRPIDRSIRGIDGSVRSMPKIAALEAAVRHRIGLGSQCDLILK